MKTRKLRIKRKVVVKSRKKGKLNRKISYHRKQRKSRNIRKKHNRTRKNRVMRGGVGEEDEVRVGLCERELLHYFDKPNHNTEYILKKPSNKILHINVDEKLNRYITPNEVLLKEYLNTAEQDIVILFSHKHFIQNYVKKYTDTQGFDMNFDMDNGDYICIQDYNSDKGLIIDYTLKKTSLYIPPQEPTVTTGAKYLILVRHCYRYCQDYDKRLALFLHDPMCNEGDTERGTYESTYGIKNLKKLFIKFDPNKVVICSSALRRAINSASLFIDFIKKDNEIILDKFDKNFNKSFENYITFNDIKTLITPSRKAEVAAKILPFLPTLVSWPAFKNLSLAKLTGKSLLNLARAAAVKLVPRLHSKEVLSTNASKVEPLPLDEDIINIIPGCTEKAKLWGPKNYCSYFITSVYKYISGGTPEIKLKAHYFKFKETAYISLAPNNSDESDNEQNQPIRSFSIHYYNQPRLS